MDNKERNFPYRFSNVKGTKFSEWGISADLVKKLADAATKGGQFELSLSEIREIYKANPRALKETALPMRVKPREPDLILCQMWVGHQDYGKNPLDLI